MTEYEKDRDMVLGCAAATLIGVFLAFCLKVAVIVWIVKWIWQAE